MFAFVLQMIYFSKKFIYENTITSSDRLRNMGNN